MEAVKNLAYAAMTVLVLCGAWVGVGFVSRFIVWLFCIGYGCK